MFYIDNELQPDTRYDMIKFLNFDEDNIDVLNSYMMYNIKRLPEQGSITITVPEKRPDMLSHKIYGHTQYWWLLMWYNSFLTVDELKTGTTVKFFSLDALQDLYTQACKYAKAV